MCRKPHRKEAYCLVCSIIARGSFYSFAADTLTVFLAFLALNTLGKRADYS